MLKALRTRRLVALTDQRVASRRSQAAIATIYLVGEVFGDGEGVTLGDGDGVGLATVLARALLEVVVPGVRIADGPTLAK